MAEEKGHRLPGWARGLSARLLLLTIFFVMLAEVFIFVPSLANFRFSWLSDKIAGAHLAVLTLEVSPTGQAGADLRADLLDRVGAYAIILHRSDRRLAVFVEAPPAAALTVDLANLKPMRSIFAALNTLIQPENRVLRLLGPVAGTPDTVVEIVFDEQILRRAMLVFSRNVLLLSLIISAITALLLYGSLHWLMVLPIRRIIEGVTEFAHDPENTIAGVRPTGRTDEIGIAQQALAEMQADLRASLKQKEHLAALGSAISKINHDLRGILSTAVLVSDRLTMVDDPEVKRIAPTLLQAIDRAINLCTQTLNFARDEGPQLSRERFRLHKLIDEVARDIAVLEPGAASIANQVGPDFVVEADRDQLYRVFANLALNALRAGADEVKIVAENSDGKVHIEVADDGPGISKRARDNLFMPFVSASKHGGTGLGLVIARDVMRAHGGELDLAGTSDKGTIFALSLPL